jgi:mannose-6-phosphate isomerase-like protein (cupin superfamily)
MRISRSMQVRVERLRFRLGARGITLVPGQSVMVPPGSVHAFANSDPEPVRVLVHTRPALRMQALLQTAAAPAGDQQASGLTLVE